MEGLERSQSVAGAIQGIDYRVYLQELRNPNSLPPSIWAAPLRAPGGSVAERAMQRYPPLRPGAQLLATTADFSVVYRVNARGLRDRDYASTKPPGVRRVLAFGDSFTFGSGVPDEDRFTEVAEARLDGVEVLNMGAPGYGLDQILLSFLAQGRDWAPDDVVVFLNGYVANRHRTGIVRDGAVHLPADVEAVRLDGDTGGTVYVGPDDPLWGRDRHWLLRHSYALAFLAYRLRLHALHARFAAQDEKRWRRQKRIGQGVLGPDPNPERRERTRLLVEVLRDAVEEAGARLTMVNIDRRQTVGHLRDVPGITVVDLAPDLYARAQTTELSFTYDQHYNPETHRWLGERVAHVLAESAP